MKGIHVIEEVIPSVLAERNDLHFVLVGEGERGLSVPKPLSDYITVIGAVPPSKVPSYLFASDILVLPSLSEGVPRVLLESLYMKTPVLANHVGDVPSVTENTCTSTEEFSKMLVDFEELNLYPIEPFKAFIR